MQRAGRDAAFEAGEGASNPFFRECSADDYSHAERSHQLHLMHDREGSEEKIGDIVVTKVGNARRCKGGWAHLSLSSSQTIIDFTESHRNPQCA